MNLFQVNRLKKLPIIRDDEFWEVAAMPMGVSAPLHEGGPDEQIVVCVCASSAGGYSCADLQSIENFSDSAAIQAVCRFALEALEDGGQPVGYLPGLVRIGGMPATAQRFLANILKMRGVKTEVDVPTPVVAEVIIGIARDLAKEAAPPNPDIVAAPGLGTFADIDFDRITAYADAAKAFWLAAPGRFDDNNAIWSVEPTPSNKSLSYCILMGFGDEPGGIDFFSYAEQVNDLLEILDEDTDDVDEEDGDEPDEADDDQARCFADIRLSIHFHKESHAPADDVLLWKHHGLALAAADAYPTAVGRLGRHEKLSRPSGADLTTMESILRCFAAASAKEIQAGLITHKVETFDGPRTITLRAVPFED
jgi:hypothetical protein